MANRPPSGEDNSGVPLHIRIARDLDQTGRALELRTMRSFIRGGCSYVEPAVHYRVDSEHPWRELDVLARFDGPQSLRVTVVVECKSSPKRPWVVLMGHNASLTDPYDASLPYPRANVTRHPNFADAMRWLGTSDSFPVKTKGHAIVEAFKGETGGRESLDPPFDALRQVQGAAQAIRSAAANDRKGQNPTVVVPLVVIAAPLFEASLDEAGELDVTEVGHSAVFRPGLDDHSPILIVQVVTEAFLATWIEELVEGVGYIPKLL